MVAHGEIWVLRSQPNPDDPARPCNYYVFVPSQSAGRATTWAEAQALIGAGVAMGFRGQHAKESADGLADSIGDFSAFNVGPPPPRI